MKKTPKNSNTFGCEICNFKCFNKQDYTRHLSTVKHVNLTNPNAANEKAPISLNCKCGKTYLHMSSLCKHKKTCSFITMNQDKAEEPVPDNKDVMIEKLVEELTAERAEKSDMKSMFMMMMEKFQEMQQQNNEIQQQNKELQMKTNENAREILKETIKESQELVNKVIDMIPKMGNTTNNNTTNNTLKKRVE